MRFLFALIIFIMVLTIIFFAFNNVGTTVPVTLINTFPELPLIAVVIASITFGVIFVGIVAIIEGATTRFENLRLRRQVHKLETELNFLRTEPGTRPDAPPKPALPPPGTASRETPAADSAADSTGAPAHGSDGKGKDTDPEDDMYAGGSAV